MTGTWGGTTPVTRPCNIQSPEQKGAATMAVRLSHMKAKVKESQITWDDETVDFAYKPNEFTMDLADQIDAAAKSEDTGIVSMLLAPIIVWWDVLDDKDKRLPADAETMGQFPLNFLLAIMRQITADQDPEHKG